MKIGKRSYAGSVGAVVGAVALVVTAACGEDGGLHGAVARAHGADAPATAAAPAAINEVVTVALGTLGGRMTVPVETEAGETMTFLVGTGTSVTVITESTAQKLGAGGVTLGGLAVEMSDRVVIPDADLAYDGTRVDGMVGVNTLNRFDVLFDVPAGEMRLAPVGPRVEWPGATLSEPIPLRVYHGVVIGLDVTLNGHEVPAMLELGSPTLLANQGALDEAGIEGETVDELAIGGSTYRSVPVQASDHPVIERFSPTGSPFVLLGTPIALDCALAVSWAHSEMRTCVR